MTPPRLTLSQLYESTGLPLPETAPHLISKDGEFWVAWSRPFPKEPAETIYELSPKGRPFHADW